jgi:5-methylcytosine-specific restriction endonuclease McrA
MEENKFDYPEALIDGSSQNRNLWIKSTYDNFVGSPANKEYYRVILETLWPEGTSLPGPLVSRIELRDAIESYRESQGSKRTYQDAFRRLRELQGEEGIVGITKVGAKYRLQSLILEPKRIPRVPINKTIWNRVLIAYGHKCASCGRPEPEVKFEPDHKIPRLRGGGNDESNWQPLCTECNNWKSTQCRACKLDCEKCPWAYPERYPRVKLSSATLEKLALVSYQLGASASEVAETAINAYTSVIVDKKLE